MNRKDNPGLISANLLPFEQLRQDKYVTIFLEGNLIRTFSELRFDLDYTADAFPRRRENAHTACALQELFRRAGGTA